MRLEVHSLVAEDDLVATRLTVHGTHDFSWSRRRRLGARLPAISLAALRDHRVRQLFERELVHHASLDPGHEAPNWSLLNAISGQVSTCGGEVGPDQGVQA